MRKSQKIMFATGLGVAALVGGTAFTGTGVTDNAGATRFLGGTVSRSVTGATLSTVAYAFADAPANTGPTERLFRSQVEAGSSPGRMDRGGRKSRGTARAVALGLGRGSPP